MSSDDIINKDLTGSAASSDSEKYLAIIGDIKFSREIADREGCQERLRNVLDLINDKYKDDIASNFTITLGDEFQGLLSAGTSALEMLTLIDSAMYPVRLRFGIGIGPITTKINRELSIGADGPAYYRARSAIEHVHDKEHRRKSAPADMMIISDNAEDSYINCILSLMYAISDTWSERQRMIIMDMIQNRDSQIDVARRHNVKQPTIHSIIANGRYYAYQSGYDQVDEYLSRALDY